MKPEVTGPTNDADPSFVLMASEKLKSGKLRRRCVWKEKVRLWGQNLLAENMELVRRAILERDDMDMASCLNLTAALRSNRDSAVQLGDGRLQA